MTECSKWIIMENENGVQNVINYSMLEYIQWILGAFRGFREWNQEVVAWKYEKSNNENHEHNHRWNWLALERGKIFWDVNSQTFQYVEKN